MPVGFHLSRVEANLDDLMLDPNNPRFLDIADWEPVQPNQYHQDTKQNQAFQRLEGMHPGEIENLRSSIISNGFIPSELIVVKPYAFDQSKFIVIEGNRRLTALKGIVQNSEDPDSDLVKSICSFEVMLYTPTGDDEQDKLNEMILQGIRHISGPREWGAYQKANLVVQLHDGSGQEWSEIGSRLGLGPRVTTRYYRSFKALRQMMDDEEFKDASYPDQFSLFDEALNRPAIKDWLDWSESNMRFQNDQRLKTFYGLLIKDSGTKTARLNNPQHMRSFAKLVASQKQHVLQGFLDGQSSIEQAEQQLQEPVPVLLNDSLQTFLSLLTRVPVDQLAGISATDLTLFDQITAKLRSYKAMHIALAAAQIAPPEVETE